MFSGSVLHLQLLDTHFAIHAGPNENGFLEELWRPFVVEPRSSDFDVLIEQTLSGWHIDITAQEEATADDAWQLVEELRYRMVERAIGASRETIGLHAGVVRRDDRLLLLPGGSGKGKTSLTLALVDQGWDYYSDDVAPIVRNSRDVLPFPKPVNIKRIDLWPRYRQVWDVPEWVPSPSRSFMIPAACLGTVPTEPARATHIVLPHYQSDSPTRLEEVTGAQAAAWLGQYVRRADQRTISDLVQLCGQTRRANLVFGNSDEAIRAVESWLSSAR